jgi:Asp-tRNA(Asn)/Glu-tRNA(Gln) amidotransferase C subunit
VELGPEQVAHVARIARLALTPAEQARLSQEAGRILEDFRAIEAALAGAPPAEPPAAPAEPRPDELVPADPAQVEALVAQFPRKEGRLCKVPEAL